MLALLVLLTLPLLVPADAVICASPPRPIVSPTHADAVYFLFVIDNSWPEYKIAQQKALYQMIACEIPRSTKYRVGTIYAYAPKPPADFAFNDKSLATADRFTTTLNDAIERSYLTRARLPYDRSRCSRMHAVMQLMRLADFSYDTSVHTHYIFPTDDSEDDFVNDCDPAWTFKQSARNILRDATPNHLYLDVIRIGVASRWTQYGERVQLADWSDGSINQKNVSHLFAGFLDGALTGEAVNDVIVFGTNGMARNERPKGLATLVTEPTPPPPSSSTSSSTTTSTASTTTTSAAATTTTTVPTTAAATTVAPAAVLPRKRGRSTAAAVAAAAAAEANLTLEMLGGSDPDAKQLSAEKADPGVGLQGEMLSDAKSKRKMNRRELNSTGEPLQNTTTTPQESDKKANKTVLGFNPTVFYVIVGVTTLVSILLLWLVCGLVFYCCYRDDDSLKKHDKKEAEAEDEMLLISGLGENEWDKPSNVMISDHLRRVKEEQYQEEQQRSSESRGTITVEA